MTLYDKTKNINYLTCTSVNYYIKITFLYIQVKAWKEGAFLNRLAHKREGAEHFSLSHLRLKMRIFIPSRTMGATRLLDDRIRISSETLLFDQTRQRDVSNMCVGFISLHAPQKRHVGLML
jgi:hypothetical protein